MKNISTAFIHSIFSSILLLILLVSCSAPKEKKYNIGVISGLNFFEHILDGFKEKMNELGYVEGQNVSYDINKTDFDLTAYRQILNRFIKDKVDLIFVFPTEVALEAKVITKGTGIPVVFAGVFTEGSDLIKNIIEPGDNVTGIRLPGPDLALQGLEIMQEILPTAKIFLIPHQKDCPIVPPQLEVLRDAAKIKGLTLIEIPVNNPNELETTLKKQAPNPDAIILVKDPIAASIEAFTVLAKFVGTRKIPIGGTMFSYQGHETVFDTNPRHAPMGKKAAILIDKILKGTPAGTIPVLSTDSFLKINYRALQKMGIEISEGLLDRANEVIQ